MGTGKCLVVRGAGRGDVDRNGVAGRVAWLSGESALQVPVTNVVSGVDGWCCWSAVGLWCFDRRVHVVEWEGHKSGSGRV